MYCGASFLAILVASTTLSTSGDFAEPFVEKLIIATFGSISNNSAVFAESTAISANSCAVGFTLIAQSEKTYFS